jgi:cell division protease FtsH
VLGPELDDLIAEMRPEYDFHGRRNVRTVPDQGPVDSEPRSGAGTSGTGSTEDPDESPAPDDTSDDMDSAEDSGKNLSDKE